MSLDNEHWHLSISMEWTPKKPTSESQICSRCNGRRVVGGGFKSFEDEHTCPDCFGTGHRTKYLEYPAAPPLPLDLIEELKQTYSQHCENKTK